jgi:hypothetical protein
MSPPACRVMARSAQSIHPGSFRGVPISTMKEELLLSKELAAALKRSPTYIMAMRRQGFRMINHRTTLSAALLWLSRHPHPRAGERRRS